MASRHVEIEPSYEKILDRESTTVFKPLLLPLVVSFRICERRDLRSLEWHGLFTAHRRIIRAAFREQEKGRNLMLLAEIEGAPIGQVWIAFQRNGSESVAFLWALRVIPWLQGLGLGSRLVQVAEQIARARNCTGVELGVEKHNRRARKLYERLDYEVVGQLEDEYHYTTPSGRRMKMKLNEFLMRKMLRDSKSHRATVSRSCAHLKTLRGGTRRKASGSRKDLAPGTIS